ncbi:hypothetical protein Tco_1071576 [Tanacetum coccineum]
MNSSAIVSRIHLTNSNGLKKQFQLQNVVQKPLQKGIDNDIYSTVNACPNACKMWKAIERLKQGFHTIRLRTEASKFEVVEKSLCDEVESLKERNTTLEKEKSVLDVRVLSWRLGLPPSLKFAPVP